MFQRDYLMRMLAEFAEAIRRSIEKATGQNDPKGAADMLEVAIGEATDIDGATLLALSPETIVTILQVSGVDEHIMGYLAHSMKLAGDYLDQAGDSSTASIRHAQANAIANAYGIDLSDDSYLDEADAGNGDIVF